MSEAQEDKVIIGFDGEGWTVVLRGKQYTWDHDEPDMGSLGIQKMLEDLGFQVTVEEWY